MKIHNKTAAHLPHRVCKTSISFAIALLLLLSLMAPVFAQAETGDAKVVRVGWFNEPFTYYDSLHRRTGYAYDYQEKIAAYTGWTYEYVEDSWPNLLQMLMAGEIDLLSDVSYKADREGKMLFSSLPMGAEAYYLFIAQDNTAITSENSASLNGKRVGVNAGSIQAALFAQWAEGNGVSPEIVELTTIEEESFQMLRRGEIDALISTDTYGDEQDYVPVFKVGQSDYYFALNKDRPDLADELNLAMSKIQDENRFYNQQLYEKYIQSAGTNAYLSAQETQWLDAHGTIRVGYLADYPPFCEVDAETGALTGALADYLALAAGSVKNTEIAFEPYAYASMDLALEALQSGAVDCVFPVSLHTSDAEALGIMKTSPIMQTEMYAVVRKGDHQDISPEQAATAAVKVGDMNGEAFLKDYFPDWELARYDGAEACFQSVSEGACECIFVSNYRLPHTEALQEQYKLTPIATGMAMSFSFAVRRGDGALYYILNKCAGLVPRTSVNSALTAHSQLDVTYSIREFVDDHPFLISGIIIGLGCLLVLFLVYRSRRIKREWERQLELQNQIIEKERARSRSDAMIRAMAADYRSVYYIDLDRDEGLCYRADSKLSAVQEGEAFPFWETVQTYATAHVVESDREGFLRFASPDYIREGLAQEDMLTFRYLSNWDGQERYEMLRIAGVEALADRKGQAIHAVGMGFSDVDKDTRETMAQSRALSDALQQAESANAAKTSFLGSLSHEIRTPMNAIIGLDSIALKEPDLSPRTREHLEKIGVSASHLLGLINDVLDMSRIDSGHMTLQNIEFSFSGMIEQLNAMIHGQCLEKGLDYDCRIEGHVEDYYIGDEMKLTQVLLNILGNAVKFTPAPGTVTFLITPVAQFEDNATLRFTVQDTGIGMSAEFLPKLFDTFAQEDENKANKFGSTGLGMAIAKNIVEMMNGKIEVESEKGVGTTFTVTVTLKSAAKTDHTIADTLRSEDLQILVIDDDPVSCEHALVVLREVGAKADACRSGEEAYEMIALAQARQEPYNLILSDWKMPGEDGVTIARNLREKHGLSSAIILVTAYSWDDIYDEARDAGVDGFMAKPLFASRVLQGFREAIQNRANAQPPHKAQLEGRHVLVAEDMLINAEILIELLSMREITADHAENGQIAVDLFRDSAPNTYDAILMDIRMPVLDGWGATEAIRALDRPDAKTVPIIAVTANALDEDVQRSLQAGMNAHLSKPVDPDRVFETLEALIRDP